MNQIDNKRLFHKEFLNRENNTRHHYYDEEMKLYEMMKAGDMCAVETALAMFTSALCGHLSDNPLTNYKYLFVASITLTTRFAIEGGLDTELAYNASDLYIQQLDLCNDTDRIFALYTEMFTFFTQKMASLKKKDVFSKPVLMCMDYINHHLHEKMTVSTLAEQVRLNPNYLSKLFKKETGKRISEYITDARIEAAKNLLLYSDTSYAEIASILAFSSQSHFIKVFRQACSYTPREYQKKHFRSTFMHSDKFTHIESEK